MMMLIVCYILLLATLADSVYRPTSSIRVPNLSNIRGPLTTCQNRSFGSSDLKIPICRTVWQYSPRKRPIETCTIGRLTLDDVSKLREAFGGILQPSHQKAGSRGLTHDGDMCCPTIRQLTKAPARMTNVYDAARDIVNIAEHGLFQYYAAGTCVSSSDMTNCKGTCVQEMATVYLLAMRDDLPMGTSFEPFEIPSYCSCKNLGSGGIRGSVSREPTITPTPTSTNTPTTTRSETDKTTAHISTLRTFERPTPPALSVLNRTANKEAKPQPMYRTAMLLNGMKYSRIIPASMLRPTRRPAVPRVMPDGHTSSPKETLATESTNTTQSLVEATGDKTTSFDLSETEYDNNTTSGTNSSLT